MKKMKMSVIIIVLFSIVVGCAVQESNKELKLGKYVIKNSETEDVAWFVLSKDNEFEFNRNKVMSYRPKGIYKVENDTLILFVNKEEIYKFKINGEEIIFISGDFVETFVEKGTIFKLSANK